MAKQYSNPRLPFTATTPTTTYSSPEVDRIPHVTSNTPKKVQSSGRPEVLEQRSARLPDLNIITNFSKPQAKSSETAGSLAPNQHGRQDSIQHRRKRSRENQGKGPIDSLRNSENPASGLSPGDRDLMIGISMSSVTGNRARQGTIVEHDPQNEPKSANPEIIITPAGIESPWNDHLGVEPRQRGRATSSVYSRATHIPGLVGAHASPMPPVPPIPQLPQQARISRDATESRVTSWAESDDDDHHASGVDRPESRESQIELVRKNSTDTLATRHRSKGWWNEIVTPFLDRTKSQKTNQFATPKIASQFDSPKYIDEEARKKRETGRTSVWFDKSRDTLAFFRDGDSDKHASIPPPLPSAPILSPDFEETKGLGEASEYFEASWHDLNSPTPFYECVNHECAYGSRNYQRWKMVTEPVEGDRVTAGNLRSLDTNNAQYSDDFHPAERGIAGGVADNRKSHASAISIKASTKNGKHNSSPTEIEDDDDDKNSSAHEVGAAKGLASEKASSPTTPTGAKGVAPGSESKERSLDLESPVKKTPTKLPTPPLPPAPKPPVAAAAVIPDSPPAPTATRALSPEPTPTPTPAAAPAPPTNPFTDPIPASAPAHAINPFTDPILASAPSYEPTPVSTPAPAPAPAFLAPVDTTPHRAAPVDDASPGPLTPGMRQEYARYNAIPMEAPRAAPQPQPSSAPTPFFAPAPPYEHDHLSVQDRSDPVTRQIHHAGSTEALGSHPMPGTYPETREIHQGGGGAQPVTFNQNQYFSQSGSPEPPSQARSINERYFAPPPRSVSRDPSDRGGRDFNEKNEEKPKGPSFFSRVSKLFSKFGSGKQRTTEQKKRRKLFFLVFGGLIAMVILILVLVLTLVVKSSSTRPIQTSWLNLTNYPPIQTGIATIARPNVQSENGCVNPKSLWSCAVPKEEQEALKPNPPDQPNFRIEIRFQNGTNLTNSSDFTKRSVAPSGSLTASEYVQNRARLARRLLSNGLFQPSPEPPSDEEQEFLGNTTDGNQAPFGGELTPFFISFLPTQDILEKRSTPTLTKRQTTSTSSSEPISATSTDDPFKDILKEIPAPSLDSDGTAAAATLLPFPSSQPLKLYNRGRSDEHYGFYTRFERSIFLKAATPANLSAVGDIPANADGGAEKSAAGVRCTWPDTRFLVQIWTNAGSAGTLLGNGTAPPDGSAGNSSANNFEMPGTFPLPVTITLDRHGGGVKAKNMYCYGMDDSGKIVEDEKQFQLEKRGFGGQLVNGATGLFRDINVTKEEGGPGGIDGGTGGCSCQWKNFKGA